MVNNNFGCPCPSGVWSFTKNREPIKYVLFSSWMVHNIAGQWPRTVLYSSKVVLNQYTGVLMFSWQKKTVCKHCILNWKFSDVWFVSPALTRFTQLGPKSENRDQESLKVNIVSQLSAIIKVAGNHKKCLKVRQALGTRKI